MPVIRFGVWDSLNEGIRTYTRIYLLGIWTPFCRISRWDEDWLI